MKKRTLKQAERELFKSWPRKPGAFVSDGVVDEQVFLKSKLKIGFILKEANSDESFSLTEDFLVHGGRSASWNNITRWCIGIRNLPGITHYEDVRHISEDMRKEVLSSIVAMNLKKRPGGSSTDMSKLEKDLTFDSEFLSRQFLLYGLQVAICCGTFEVAHRTFAHCKDMNVQVSRRGFEYVEYDKGHFLINYFHPQVRYPGNLLFYGIVDTVKELLRD
jgi:hypothetical protein